MYPSASMYFWLEAVMFIPMFLSDATNEPK